MYYQYVCDNGEEKSLWRNLFGEISVALVWWLGILVTGAGFCTHGKQ